MRPLPAAYVVGLPLLGSPTARAEAEFALITSLSELEMPLGGDLLRTKLASQLPGFPASRIRVVSAIQRRRLEREKERMMRVTALNNANAVHAQRMQTQLEQAIGRPVSARAVSSSTAVPIVTGSVVQAVPVPATATATAVPVVATATAVPIQNPEVPVATAVVA